MGLESWRLEVLYDMENALYITYIAKGTKTVCKDILLRFNNLYSGSPKFGGNFVSYDRKKLGREGRV